MKMYYNLIFKETNAHFTDDGSKFDCLGPQNERPATAHPPKQATAYVNLI